jgi:exopolyphosphatase/guanosine-5'-triphosphate,3'-diphosphate pyrophosphatase
MHRTIETLKYFRDVINSESIDYVLPFATSAVREAENKNLFLTRIEKESGFKFKVLSSEEEAVCSYYGAQSSICLPNCLFFDLGGGSLEIVYSQNYKIKKVISLPLGSLKLSQYFFSNKHNDINNKKSKNNFSHLNSYILNHLSTMDDLAISPESVVLIGVGGTLRALARYDQLIKEYPYRKLHRYNLDYTSISIIEDNLLKMNKEELSKIDVINPNRAETIQMGIHVIYSLMSKLKFKNLLVSTKGLREGILLNFLNSLYLNKNQSFLQDHRQNFIEETIMNNFKKESKSPSFINQLLFYGLVSQYEFDIINKAIPYIYNHINHNTTSNYLSKFQILLDEDILELNHQQQIILALSVIAINKSKISLELSKQYNSILNSLFDKKQTRRIIERISTLLKFFDFIKKNKSKVIIKNYTKETHTLLLDIIIQGDRNKTNFPEILFQEIILDFKSLFDLSIQYVKYNQDKKMQSKMRSKKY